MNKKLYKLPKNITPIPEIFPIGVIPHAIMPIDFSIQINSEQELEDKLKQYHLYKFVCYHTSIAQSCIYYPVLKDLFYTKEGVITMSSSYLNTFLHTTIIPEKAPITSLLINWILNMYYFSN